jgi:hypothetical protein
LSHVLGGGCWTSASTVLATQSSKLSRSIHIRNFNWEKGLSGMICITPICNILYAYQIGVRYGFMFDTVQIHIQYIMWYIRLFCSLCPIAMISDSSWYELIHVWLISMKTSRTATRIRYHWSWEILAKMKYTQLLYQYSFCVTIVFQLNILLNRLMPYVKVELVVLQNFIFY